MHIAAALFVLTTASASAQDTEAPPPPPPPPAADDGEETTPPPPPPPAAEEGDTPAAPPAPKAKADGGGSSVDPNEGLDFMERWWPLGFSDDLAKPVDDALLFFFLAGVPCLPLGHIWLPFLVVGENPDGYLVEAILLWVIHIAPHFLIAILSVPLGIIPIIGPITAGFLGLTNCVLGIGNCLYFMPVAYANAYSRHIKAAAGSSASAARVPPRGVRVGRRSIAASPTMAY